MDYPKLRAPYSKRVAVVAQAGLLAKSSDGDVQGLHNLAKALDAAVKADATAVTKVLLKRCRDQVKLLADETDELLVAVAADAEKALAQLQGMIDRNYPGDD